MCTQTFGYKINSARHRTEIIFNMFVSPSTNRTDLVLNADFSRKYVSDALERVSDCYEARIKNSEEIGLLGKSTVIISGEEEGRDEI